MATRKKTVKLAKGSDAYNAALGKLTTTMAEALPQGNARFLVLDFERVYSTPGEPDSKYRYEVYLLPPGAFFEGFGGSRSGLLVNETPSLIVRTRGGGVWRDHEYPLNAKGVWQHLIAEGLTHFSTLHGNGAKPRDAEGFYTAD